MGHLDTQFTRRAVWGGLKRVSKKQERGVERRAGQCLSESRSVLTLGQSDSDKRRRHMMEREGSDMGSGERLASSRLQCLGSENKPDPDPECLDLATSVRCLSSQAGFCLF